VVNLECADLLLTRCIMYEPTWFLPCPFIFTITVVLLGVSDRCRELRMSRLRRDKLPEESGIYLMTREKFACYAVDVAIEKGKCHVHNYTYLSKCHSCTARSGNWTDRNPDPHKFNLNCQLNLECIVLNNPVYLSGQPNTCGTKFSYGYPSSNASYSRYPTRYI